MRRSRRSTRWRPTCESRMPRSRGRRWSSAVSPRTAGGRRRTSTCWCPRRNSTCCRRSSCAWGSRSPARPTSTRRPGCGTPTAAWLSCIACCPVSASSPKRSATFASLVAAGLLAPPPSPSPTPSFRPRGDLRLPRRELLTAHALVHAIAQHGLAPAVFPGFLFLGDLVDLAFRGSGGRATLAAIVPWIEREVSYEEAEAALDLATALAAGDGRLLEEAGAGRSRARRLLDHFLAGVTNPGYAMAFEDAAPRTPALGQVAGGGEGRAPGADAGAAGGRVVAGPPELSRPASGLCARCRQAKVGLSGRLSEADGSFGISLLKQKLLAKVEM